MTRLRDLLSPAAITRLALPWLAALVLALLMPALQASAPTALIVTVLLAVIAVIIIAAFGAVQQAEGIAHRLGDPYGTLVLTLSVVLIEVVLISAVMLGPGDHATIARDSVSAVMMIIMNLVVGACLIAVGIRRGRVPAHNRIGTSAYLVMIAVLTTVAFIVPAVMPGGVYSPAQAIVLAVLTLALYGWFLMRQMGAQAADFQEVAPTEPAAESVVESATSAAPAASPALRQHLGELVLRSAMLIATLVPIVLLSHSLAGLLDETLERMHAPAALSGLVIAVIVFTPETITALRAALGGETQRVSNLNLGAFVSTVGLTIPAVLMIGLITGQSVLLATSPVMLALVIATLVLSAITWLTPRPTPMHGAAHVFLFAVYVLMLLSE